MSTRLAKNRVRPVERCLDVAPVRPILAVLLILTTSLVPGLFAQKVEKTGRKVIVTVKPEYPETLQRAQIGGLVRLSVTVTPNGTVSKVQIRGGNPILAECASNAVMKWKYVPAAAETDEEVSINFSPH